MLAYLVAGLTATVLLTAVAQFWRLCFEHEGPAEPRAPVDDPQAPDSTTDAKPPSTNSPGEAAPTGSDSPDSDTPTDSDSLLDDAPPAPEADGAPTASDAPAGDAPTAPDSTTDAKPPATDSPDSDTPTDSDSPRDDAPPAPEADGAPPASGAPVGDAPTAPDSTTDAKPPATDSPDSDTPTDSDSLLDDATPAPEADGATAPDSTTDATTPAGGAPGDDATTATDSTTDATTPAGGAPGDGATTVPDSPGSDTPTVADSPLDDAPPAPVKTDAPATPPGVRWSWRSHRLSGLGFLRVTVTNPGPNPLTVTGVRLRPSDELARHADRPALLDASDYAAELFRQAPEAARLPRTLEPEGSTDAYFPCRDVADWLYEVAESHNIDRIECHLTPECVDSAGNGHPARRRVDYERWLQHGHGPSLREHAEQHGSQTTDQ